MLRIWIVMIIIKYSQIKDIVALNNSQEVDTALNKPKQKSR